MLIAVAEAKDISISDRAPGIRSEYVKL